MCLLKPFWSWFKCLNGPWMPLSFNMLSVPVMIVDNENHQLNLSSLRTSDLMYLHAYLICIFKSVQYKHCALLLKDMCKDMEPQRFWCWIRQKKTLQNKSIVENETITCEIIETTGNGQLIIIFLYLILNTYLPRSPKETALKTSYDLKYNL